MKQIGRIERPDGLGIDFANSCNIDTIYSEKPSKVDEISIPFSWTSFEFSTMINIIREGNMSTTYKKEHSKAIFYVLYGFHHIY